MKEKLPDTSPYVRWDELRRITEIIDKHLQEMLTRIQDIENRIEALQQIIKELPQEGEREHEKDV